MGGSLYLHSIRSSALWGICTLQSMKSKLRSCCVRHLCQAFVGALQVSPSV